MGCLFDSSFLDLEIINNVKFSLREVDIVSCIVNGRSPKFIAHLLDISPKTVEAHIRNIKIKMNCSSKEQMVSFIEKSNKYQLISQHYRDLIVNVEFEKSLQNVSVEITNKSIELQIICLIKNDNEEDIKCCKLIKHLFMAGIKANLEYKNPNDLDFKANRYVLLCSAQTAREICNLYKEQVRNIVFFTDEPLDIEQKSQIISSATPNNYYSSVLELIGKFYSSEQVESLINKFRSFYEGNSPDFYANSQIVRSKYSWNKHKILITSCLILILLTCLFLLFYTSTRSKSINMYTQFINKDILLPRKNLIHEINEVFKKQSGIKYAILVGEGGMGKTVISRHYLQLNDFKVKAEINAETYNSLSDSFANLAITLANTKDLQERLSYIRAITDCKRRSKQVFLFVLSQLREVGNWCLLFDNVDDFNLIRDFIPINDGTYNNGKVIITTRNENFKNVTIFPRFCAINVPLLTVNEQEELFSKITCGKDKRNEAVEQSVLKNFLKNIPSMPLDVCAAAFYIKNTRISFGEYLKLSKNPCQSIEKIQSNFLAEGINYDKTRYGIISSVFEKIIKTNADFKELLLFICLLDSQNIPKAYLEKCKDHAVVQDFIHNLRKYSLITEKNGTFSIHRSTQEIGLKYILSRLSEDEKIRFLNDIVKIMTPYDCMLWSYYSTQKHRMTIHEIKSLLIHLERMSINIENIPNLKQIEEYKTKLLLAKLYAYLEDKSATFTNPIIKQILDINKWRKYLSPHEFAVVSLNYVYTSIQLGNFGDQNIEKHLENVLKECISINNSDNLKIHAMSAFARLYCERGEFSKCLYYLKKAKEALLKLKNENIYLPTLAGLCNEYYYCISSHYIVKKELLDAVDFFNKTLKEFGASDFFHRKAETPRVLPYYVHGLRRNLAGAYNRLERYKEALECEKESAFFYNHSRKQGVRFILHECLLEIEYGYTLLRSNQLNEAHKIFSHVIKTKKDLRDFFKILYALVYRSEANIRLNKLEDGYKDSREALNFANKSKTNSTKLMEMTCYYNMAIVKYKQNELKKSLEHFKIFFKLSKEFCLKFLEESVYKQILSGNVFETLQDESQIKTYLQNSLKIFTAIYGEKHSFIKNYVKKTLSKP